MTIGIQGVLLLVLGTAVLHAAWNAMAKSIGDRWVSSALIGTVNGAFGLVLIGLFGVPAPASWPYLVASALLQATYLVLLTHSYAHGDLSRLYPILRGTSPVVVTAVAVTVLAERLSPLSWLGLGVLVGGIALLACARGLPRADTGLVLALSAGLVIACYSLSDGVGVRIAGDTGAYIGWMFALQAPTLLLLCRWQAGRTFWGRMWTHAPVGLLGGVFSVISYGTTVWAQSRAPLALVAALRETSVVWGALLGGLLLKEKLTATERAAVLAVAAGAVVLQVGA
ncbi:EamA family transporter [Janibacter corallicola]|uniref:EamA family transporter n=1 Tax=Janibacter corallicola TaxID=415212 RepID=UPI0008295A52|nr:EamA family transporter [Janibacter corallicola]